MARGLDRVGERWTLLIARNLLLGGRRYSDLLEELPGITTNLLAKRLREMEALGLIVKRDLPSPVRATVYELTDTGAALEPVIIELGRWGWRFMDGPRHDDTVNVAWALLSLKRRYRGDRDAVVGFRIGARNFELGLAPRYLSVKEREAARPGLVVEGTLEAFRCWLFGVKASVGQIGGAPPLTYHGSREALVAFGTAFEPSLSLVGLRSDRAG